MDNNKKQRSSLGTPRQRNEQQYHMELPPVNFKKNDNVVSPPYTDDLKTKD
jgi:hypothetical protein